MPWAAPGAVFPPRVRAWSVCVPDVTPCEMRVPAVSPNDVDTPCAAPVLRMMRGAGGSSARFGVPGSKRMTRPPLPGTTAGASGSYFVPVIVPDDVIDPVTAPGSPSRPTTVPLDVMLPLTVPVAARGVTYSHELTTDAARSPVPAVAPDDLSNSGLKTGPNPGGEVATATR